MGPHIICLTLVKILNIPMVETTNYGVIMAGKAVHGGGMCKDVTVRLQVMTIVEDFPPLELGSLDMVLGMQWLCKQGAMTVDWR